MGKITKKRKEALSLFDRDAIYSLNEACEIVKKITKTKNSLIINCGYGKGYSVKEIVDIFKLLKKNVIVEYQKRRPGDISQIYADTKKIRKILNWKQKFNNIKKILLSAIKWENKLNKV